jgi:hypothetical protein
LRRSFLSFLSFFLFPNFLFLVAIFHLLLRAFGLAVANKY